MESATFHKWLADRGCRFDTVSEQRGLGHATVTVHHNGHTAQVHMGGPRQNLDARVVRQACEDLGLDAAQLPGFTTEM